MQHNIAMLIVLCCSIVQQGNTTKSAVNYRVRQYPFGSGQYR